MARTPAPNAATTRRQVDRLRALAGDPDSQAAFALEVLSDVASQEALAAAARVLTRSPRLDAHDAILRQFDALASTGPKADPGGATRAALLQAISTIALPGDAALLEAAARTYERTMISPGGPFALRAAALEALHTADPDRAAFVATRILSEAGSEKTDEMSGEPALTAARVLAAEGHSLPLYLFLLTGRTRGGEVESECLRNLRDVPEAPLADLVAATVERGNEIVLMGLCDLALEHGASAVLLAFVARSLDQFAGLELYQYLVTAILAANRTEMLATLEAHASAVTDPRKRTVLAAALPLARGQPRLVALGEAMVIPASAVGTGD